MAARNWVECPKCGAEQGVREEWSKPAGKIGEMACTGCSYLDKKSRVPVSLKTAVAVAVKYVPQGFTVYIRDCESGKLVSFSKFSRRGPAEFDIADPTRQVVYCAVK